MMLNGPPYIDNSLLTNLQTYMLVTKPPNKEQEVTAGAKTRDE